MLLCCAEVTGPVLLNTGPILSVSKDVMVQDNEKGEITSSHLYLETIERVMERMNKIFVQDGKEQKPLDLNIIDLERKE